MQNSSKYWKNALQALIYRIHYFKTNKKANNINKKNVRVNHKSYNSNIKIKQYEKCVRGGKKKWKKIFKRMKGKEKTLAGYFFK